MCGCGSCHCKSAAEVVVVCNGAIHQLRFLIFSWGTHANICLCILSILSYFAVAYLYFLSSILLKSLLSDLTGVGGCATLWGGGLWD